MDYETPQRVYVRAKATNVAQAGDPERLRPAIAEAVRVEIAGARKVTDYGDGTYLWYAQMHWPTTAARQAAITSGLKALDTKTTWAKPADLPAPVQAAAAKVKFVGEVAMPVKTALVEKDAIKVI